MPDLTPEEEQVRRLLAGARHDEPAPDDVVARLDGVLADLRPPAPENATVADLAAARRRRRTLRNVVLAAAAVVVVGVGISRVDLSSVDGMSGADSGSAGGSAAESDTPAQSDESAPRDLDGSAAYAAGPVLRLRAKTFQADLDAYATSFSLRGGTPVPLSADDGQHAPQSSDSTTWSATCYDPAWGQGRLVPARYDGQRAALVVRRARDGEQQLDLYLCGATEPLRSTTVDVP